LPKSKKTQLKDYVAYAQHCLKTVKSIPDRRSRILFREMAAEWLNLAATVAPVRNAKPANDRTTSLPPLLPSRRQYRTRLRASQ
jgi:hypothetical protein